MDAYQAIGPPECRAWRVIRTAGLPCGSVTVKAHQETLMVRGQVPIEMAPVYHSELKKVRDAHGVLNFLDSCEAERGDSDLAMG